MKKILLISVICLITLVSKAQPDWTVDTYYPVKGGVWEECGYQFSKIDDYKSISWFVLSKKTEWIQKQYTGYIKIWQPEPKYWDSIFYDGIAWYCKWGEWYEKKINK